MVEYDPEIHGDMVQCDTCEEWFPPAKTVMVDAKMFIQKCVGCYDDEDSELSKLTYDNSEVYEEYAEELPPEEEE
jgi:hypothetical protein